ncbi:MAG: tape measure protein [Parvibaculum sp.]|uniref:tape measure protein n=1 Tax=Parvibaculum sp. TaxID=2024848 RepID=UPI002AB906CF|nr:tape measure protein [Parvibaculum sp.]MDZ4382800.1 tape measure protein [Parvibaculum sp.]
MATDLEQLIVRLEAQYQRFENDMKKASGAYDREARKIERRQKALENKLKGAGARLGRSLVPSLGAIAAGLSAREIIRYADSWTDAGNKIAAAGTPLDQQAERLRQLANAAVETRSEFEGTVNTYARLQRSTESLGLSEQKLLTLTETINKAFIVGGAAASERAAGILQLSQGIASGFLAGDELRSVRENAPLIAKAIADAMGVGIGELKKLGAEGAITVDVIIKALEKLGPQVTAQFAKTQTTVGQALTNLETRFTQFVGGLSESGAMGALAGGINVLAENLDHIAKAAGIAAAALAPAGFAAAARLAASATGALTAALLANPIGAAAAAISAVVAAMLLYKNSIYGVRDASSIYLDVAEKVEAIDKKIAEASGEVAEQLKKTRQGWIDAARVELEYLRTSLLVQKTLEGSTGRAGVGARGRLAQGREEDIRAAIEENERKLKALEDGTAAPPAGERGAAPGGDGGDGKSDAFTRAIAQIEKQTAVLEARTGAIDRSTYAQEKAAKVAELTAAAEEAKLKLDEKLTAQIDAKAEAFARAKAAENVDKALSETDEAIRGLEQETAALGLSEAAADTLRFKQELLNAVLAETGQIAPEAGAAVEAAAAKYGLAREAAEAAAKAMERQISMQDGVRDGLVDIGLAASRGAEDFSDAVGDMVRRIADLILELYVLRPLIESLFGASGTSGGGLIGQIAGALGGAFSGGGGGAGGGSMPALAGGGVTRGVSIAGEAGPEAVVPLPDGRKIPVDLRLPDLSAPRAAPVNVQVINNTPARVETSTTRDGNGRELVRFVINEVKRDFANGGFDKAQRGRYGVQPARTRR